MSTAPSTDIEHLNADCTCITLDTAALCDAAEKVVGDPGFCRQLALTHPHLLSAQPLFLSTEHSRSMWETIAAIETVVRLPAYREAVLSYAPQVARHDPGSLGVFMGYDFHIGRDGPRLIEINTNAGGALINTYLLAAQRACCDDMKSIEDMRLRLPQVEERFVAIFRDEWRRQGRTEPLRSIAIVDETPEQQYLHPEFVLFQRLFHKHGLSAFVAAPGDLSLRAGKLILGNETIDLVYNRLTDFDLSQPSSQALREVYITGTAVVTPNPRAHALFADKRNLALLSNPDRLRQLGVEQTLIDKLATGIPRTEIVAEADRQGLWARRNKLFFKPCSGYGSKAAYRGDKVTRKVWDEILAGSYVAQELVPPSTRTVALDGEVHSMKADLRNYTYAGEVLLVAARIYQGQTTNFRTRGGGFAPVITDDHAHCHTCH